ncbi:hydrogenase maturation nickel metallochaperone HypA [Tundrisphaera lichenicola]|uniref:hydrogenase maturation nickel metallochaperone HypA/HybF n=1 Tax=Tundrisphaera lichenicola TaxID=2029860 RepID=UPI003EBAF6FB
MHELSIALSLLDLVEEEATRRGCRVIAVHLRLGPLSGVIGEALLSAYDLASEGTALEGARLIVEEVPVVVFCPTCDAERAPVSAFERVCSECGTGTPEVIRGHELEVVALEVTP